MTDTIKRPPTLAELYAAGKAAEALAEEQKRVGAELAEKYGEAASDETTN